MDPGSSSKTRPASSSSQIEKVNDSMCILHKPEGKPSMQVVFFHGLQPVEDYSNAHHSAWESRDGSCIWPQKWLVEEFPDAEIVSIFYSTWLGKNAIESIDMYNLGENLISDLLQEGLGLTSHCPTILVGHSIGGLIIKQLCSQAHDMLGRKQGIKKERLAVFLKNIKGVFFYSTPDHGTFATKQLVDIIGDPLLEYVEALSTQAKRLIIEFEDTKKLYEWQVAGLGEGRETKLGSSSVMIAPEGSARCENFSTDATADHFSICKPDTKSARSFTKLRGFLADIEKSMKASHQCLGLPDYPVQLETRTQDVMKIVKDGAILGIFGMGGIGKTTLAKQVFNTMSRDFEYTCFVDNVKLTNLDQLEDRLLNHFHQRGMTLPKIQWPILKDRKTLIVMDDVDAEDQLKFLPKFQHFGKGSCLIMTSRDKELFKFYEDCVVYEVGFLEEADAMNLFCQNAFGSNEIPTLLPEIVKEVVMKCGGLPLTLEVMGRYLRGHTTDTQVWEQALGKLGKAQSITGGRNDRVWASLKVSYDSLSGDEQNMFIEAATVSKGVPLDEALAGWSSSTRHAEATWRNLVNRSLVREVDEWVWVSWREDSLQSKVVWVHEQLRDLAEKIAPGSELCGSDDGADLLVHQINNKKVELQAIYLHLWYTASFRESSEPQEILHLDKLARVKRLKYMYLIRVPSKGRGKGLTSDLAILKWVGQPGRRTVFSWFPFFIPRRCQTFPISVKDMKNLTVLELQHFVLSDDFAEGLGYLANLRSLRLVDLEGLDRLPENFGNLSLLKRLEVINLKSLKLPESLGKLKALEQLVLNDIEGLDCLPESVGNLTSLKDLEIGHCPKIKYLPQSFSRLSKLQRVNIDGCRGLETLDDAFSNLSSLRRLDLVMVGVRMLPTNIWDLPALQELYVDVDLKTLSGSICRPTNLVELTIYSDKLDTLPENFHLLECLRKLELNCRNLERLPERLGELALLEVLQLSVVSVKALPESVGKLSFLRELNFKSRDAELLPESLGLLYSLKTLELDCDSLEKLPDNLGQLSSLKTLELNCNSLEKLPDSLVELTSLEELSISARKLEFLPEKIGQLQSLTKLSLNVRSVTRLPESIGQSPSLRELEFNCSGHEENPNIFGRLSSFTQKLALTDDLMPTKQSTKLPAGLGSLSSLRFLSLKHFARLERLPEELGELMSLETLSIKWCRSLKSLPDSLGQISSLREVKLHQCIDLESLPDSLGKPSLWSELTLPQEDNISKLKTHDDESSQRKSTAGMKLCVQGCNLLSNSVLNTLGWRVISIGPLEGLRWYQRKLTQ